MPRLQPLTAAHAGLLPTALVAAGIASASALVWLASPALFRSLLLTLWLLGLATALPPHSGRRPAAAAFITALLLLHYLLTALPVSIPAGAAPADLPAWPGPLMRQGRNFIEPFLGRLTAGLWPGRLELGIAILLAALISSLWPIIRRSLLRRASNRRFQSLAWSLAEIPRRTGAWIAAESLRALLLAGLWGGGLFLLGFDLPAAAGFLMLLASPTPFWGPLGAAAAALSLAHSPQPALQAGGAIIVFAVAWLASHLLFGGRLHSARPQLPRLLILSAVFAGALVAGAGGFLAVLPLWTLALHITTGAKPPLRPAP